MFCCTLLYVHSSFAIILVGKRQLVALLSLSSWCLVIVVCSSSDAMGLSAVCDCGISLSYSLTIFVYTVFRTGDIFLNKSHCMHSRRRLLDITMTSDRECEIRFIVFKDLILSVQTADNNTTLTNFSTTHLVKCKVCHDIAGQQ